MNPPKKRGRPRGQRKLIVIGDIRVPPTILERIEVRESEITIVPRADFKALNENTAPQGSCGEALKPALGGTHSRGHGRQNQ